MFKQYYTLLIVAIIAISSCNSTPENSSNDQVIGVKIYKYDKDFAGLIKEWKEIGINTVYTDENLITKPEFMKLCKENGISTYFIARTFFNPVKLSEDSTLYAITHKGEKAIDEWVHFVCPTREEYRKERINYFKEIINTHQPDGISIDFIRYFVYWEMIHPDTSPDSISNTCFCNHCVNKFQEETSISIPEENIDTESKANWILANSNDEFTKWKIKNISSMVAEIVASVKEIKPDIKVNTHIVPWRKNDYNQARLNIAGQDIKTFIQHADFVSPMCYTFMLKRKPVWISSLVADFNSETPDKVLPSIQVKEAYLKEKFSVEDFEKCLIESLKSPSKGVVFWSWGALDKDPEKKEVIKKVLTKQ